MVTARKTLTPKQVSLLHVAQNRLGLDKATYRDVLRRAAGVESSTQLDQPGFDAVMDEFARLGFVSDARERTFGERAGMATPKQVAHIRKLWAEYTDGQGTEASLGKWLERSFHVSSLRFLPADTAPKAITALRKMTARHAAERETADGG